MSKKSVANTHIHCYDFNMLSLITSWNIWTMTFMPWEQRNVKDLENTINYQVGKISKKKETGLEIVLETLKIVTGDQQGYLKVRLDLEISLGTI